MASRAYGAHRSMTPQQKAHNVAASILAHGYDIRYESVWERYGLQENPAQQALVVEEIAIQRWEQQKKDA